MGGLDGEVRLVLMSKRRKYEGRCRNTCEGLSSNSDVDEASTLMHVGDSTMNYQNETKGR